MRDSRDEPGQPGVLRTVVESHRLLAPVPSSVVVLLRIGPVAGLGDETAELAARHLGLAQVERADAYPVPGLLIVG